MEQMTEQEALSLTFAGQVLQLISEVEKLRKTNKALVSTVESLTDAVQKQTTSNERLEVEVASMREFVCKQNLVTLRMERSVTDMADTNSDMKATVRDLQRELGEFNAEKYGSIFDGLVESKGSERSASAQAPLSEDELLPGVVNLPEEDEVSQGSLSITSWLATPPRRRSPAPPGDDNDNALGPPICRWFLKGRCKFGIECRNRHEFEEWPPM